MAWHCGAGHYLDLDFLIRRHLVLDIFPFPVSTAKLIGNLCNNRRSAAQRYPGFTYSVVFLMLRQYYWCCDSYVANTVGGVRRIQLKSAKVIGAVSVPRFIHKRRGKRSASKTGWPLHSSNPTSATALIPIPLLLLNLPINWEVLTGYRNKFRPR